MNELLRRVLFLPPQSSTVAADIDALHYAVILATMTGATLVAFVGGVFLVKYRRRGRPHAGAAALATPPRWLEAAAAGLLLLMFLAWWAVGMRQFMRLRIAPEGAMEVYVTGKQWMWKFAYPEGASTISVVYVPAEKPVKLILTSRDVIHSFFVPEFRIKQDAVPGRYTTVWFEAKRPGVYAILCAEYCGTGHSTMRGQVVALTATDFERWIADSQGRKPPLGPTYRKPAIIGELAPPEMLDLARTGELVAAEQGCLRCHTTDGTPHIGPTWAGLYGSNVAIEAGGTIRVDEAYITESMMDPAAKLHRGFRPLMPTYRGLITAPETAAVVELIKALRHVPTQPVEPRYQDFGRGAEQPDDAGGRP